MDSGCSTTHRPITEPLRKAAASTEVPQKTVPEGIPQHVRGAEPDHASFAATSSLDLQARLQESFPKADHAGAHALQVEMKHTEVTRRNNVPAVGHEEAEDGDCDAVRRRIAGPLRKAAASTGVPQKTMSEGIPERAHGVMLDVSFAAIPGVDLRARLQELLAGKDYAGAHAL